MIPDNELVTQAAAQISTHAQAATYDTDHDKLCCWVTETHGGHDHLTSIRVIDPEGHTDQELIALAARPHVADHMANFDPIAGGIIAAWMLADPTSPHAIKLARNILKAAADTDDTPKELKHGRAE